jgi:intracellular sulfur oxidation DsrE/DsrF family protein
MYDAINRGWKRAPDDVDVIAHLNCDEQYLPDALQIIANFMKSHPRADVVLADMIVVNVDGSYICHRRALRPHAFTSRFCCGGSTATTFQRASVTKDKKVFFNTSWRNFGDKVWYNALHKSGCRFAVCNQMVSLFAITGENLNWTDEGRREKRRYEQEFLHGSGMGTQLIVRYLALWRVFKEIKLDPPSSYSCYLAGKRERSTMIIENPRGLWGKKWVK